MQENFTGAQGTSKATYRAHFLCWDHERSFERSFWRSLAATTHLVFCGEAIHAGTSVPATSTHKQFKPATFLRYHRIPECKLSTIHCAAVLLVLDSFETCLSADIST